MAKELSYWEKRRAQMMYEQMEIAEDAANKIGIEYLKTAKAVHKQIVDSYNNTVNNFNIADGQIKGLVENNNISSYEELIALLKRNNAPTELIDYLSRPGQKHKYQKLIESINNINTAIDKLTQSQELLTTKALMEVSKDSYYRSIYEIQKHTSLGFSFNEWDEELFNKFAKSKWSGENYSKRIWNNRDKLAETVKNEILQGFIAGKTQNEMYDVIISRFAASNFNARRLIRTESCYAANEMEMQSYAECDIESYIFVATLDLRTSDVCASLDGQVFRVKDAMPGKNMPPMHPWCRSTTIEYTSPEALNKMKRRARDPITGKNIIVPADMKYDEWHKEFVEGNEEAIVNTQKIKNYASDNKQYKKYIERLGKNYVGKNIEEFMKIKYTNPEKYAIMKAQYKGVGYYNKALEVEPEITKLVEKVAKDSNMNLTGLEYRIKEKNSYLDKIAREYAPGYHYEVKDTLRYTMLSKPDDYVENLKNSYEMFGKNDCSVIKTKNYWTDEEMAYNGINSLLQDSNGNKFEVQYHTKESFDIKQKTHALYEKQRVLEKNSKEFITLEDEMFEINENIQRPTNIQEVK